MAMAGIVTERKAEEVRVKVEMIKTLPLLTIPLLGATPSPVLAQSDRWVLTVTGTMLS
jgi:hypothetical protein